MSLSFTAGAVVDKVFYPQLEKGTVCTDYEPYRGETLPVDPSGVTMVTAISGYNAIRADKGDVTVIGAEDPKHTIEQLRKAIGS